MTMRDTLFPVSEETLAQFEKGPVYEAIHQSYIEERRVLTAGLGKAARRERERTEHELLDDAVRQAIVSALGSPHHRWRTIRGIADEVGVDEATVREGLQRCRDQVVRSSALSKDGQELFMTRSRFLATASLSDKLLGAFKMRLA